MKRLLFILLFPAVAMAQVAAPPEALSNWPTTNTAIALPSPTPEATGNWFASWDTTNHKWIWAHPATGGSVPTGTGFYHITTAGTLDAAAKTVDVSGTDITGTLKATSFPALTGDTTATSGATATVTHAMSQDAALSGTITPTALSGDVNDYNPTGLSTASAIRQDGGAADRNITGLAGGADGRLVTFINIGTSNILILKNQSTNSTAANRFVFSSGRDALINPDGAMTVRYDGTTQRWRALTRQNLVPRITSITSAATPAINTDINDAVTITAQAVNITSMTTGLTGTPQNFQKLMIRFKDNGTGRTIAWGASYTSSQATLPTTTVANKVTTVGLVYDSVKAQWVCLAVDQEP